MRITFALPVLGRGGMGEVYKAFDPTLQRIVAVKTIGENLADTLDNKAPTSAYAGWATRYE